MSEELRELQRLSIDMDARVTIVMDHGVTRAAFKRPGHRAEIVHDENEGSRFPLFHSDDILRELLKRLGYHHHASVQTNEVFLQRLTPAQRTRLRDLLAQIKALKRDVFAPIDEIEPRLASPRSSLDRRFFDATHDLGGDDRG
jgi:hypothetical protein